MNHRATTMITVVVSAIIIASCSSPVPPRNDPATRPAAGGSTPTLIPTPTQHQPYADVDFPTPTPPEWMTKTGGQGRVEAPRRAASPAHRQLIALDIVPHPTPPPPPYDRDSWQYGADTDQDCRYTRHEILAQESAVPPTFADARQCKVAQGSWTDPWTGEKHTDPANLHIDHHVPLKNAHDTGGHAWDASTRSAFANDLDLPAALNTVAADTNLDKGARSPDQWKPPLEASHCQYARDWVAVKDKWGLAVTIPEKEALLQMLSTCPQR